jgi:hypothetical protein
LRFVSWLRPLLYALLVASAALSLASARHAFENAPAWLGVAAPASFAVFLGLFGVYRIALVRAGRYPAPKAFVQLGFGALVLMLLVPGAERAASVALPGASVPAGDDLVKALVHSDPEVRALAAELARHRPGPLRYAPGLVAALSDAEPRVRAEAARSLAAAAGTDVAEGASGEEIARRWKAWLDAHGHR